MSTLSVTKCSKSSSSFIISMKVGGEITNACLLLSLANKSTWISNLTGLSHNTMPIDYSSSSGPSVCYFVIIIFCYPFQFAMLFDSISVTEIFYSFDIIQYASIGWSMFFTSSKNHCSKASGLQKNEIIYKIIPV